MLFFILKDITQEQSKRIIKLAKALWLYVMRCAIC